MTLDGKTPVLDVNKLMLILEILYSVTLEIFVMPVICAVNSTGLPLIKNNSNVAVLLQPQCLKY